MRFKVSLKKNGKEFDEVVIANNKKEAMEVALKNNQRHKKLMKIIYKKIIFIISAIALFSVIVGVVKYSLTYIENNPDKYLPTQKQDKN